jgi:hypothetical protein
LRTDFAIFFSTNRGSFFSAMEMPLSNFRLSCSDNRSPEVCLEYYTKGNARPGAEMAISRKAKDRESKEEQP